MNCARGAGEHGLILCLTVLHMDMWPLPCTHANLSTILKECTCTASRSLRASARPLQAREASHIYVYVNVLAGIKQLTFVPMTLEAGKDEPPLMSTSELKKVGEATDSRHMHTAVPKVELCYSCVILVRY